MWLPAERTISVAHDIPHRSSGAESPRACSAVFITEYVCVGNFRRTFHIGTADALARLVNSLTESTPPSSEMTSSIVESCFVMSPVIITLRDNVKRHELEFDESRKVFKIGTMGEGTKYPYAEQGRRLRWLRQAEGIATATLFASQVGWPQSGMSQFETGQRQVPRPKAMQLRAKIPGFDPVWLWDGDKRGLSFDLRRRIEAEEAKEMVPQSASTAEG